MADTGFPPPPPPPPLIAAFFILADAPFLSNADDGTRPLCEMLWCGADVTMAVNGTPSSSPSAGCCWTKGASAAAASTGDSPGDVGRSATIRRLASVESSKS